MDTTGICDVSGCSKEASVLLHPGQFCLEHNPHKVEDVEKNKRDIKNMRKKDVVNILKNKINNLYYLAPKEHIFSILKNGILSKNEAKSLGLIKVDLSMVEAQNLRDQKEVRLSNGISCKLHSLVPLYFAPKNPSNFRMKETHNKVALLCIKKKVISPEKGNYAFSDGNMASDKPNVYRKLIDLDKLDWSVILEKGHLDYFNSGIRRKRMSELLIYPKVSTKFIEKIILPNHDDKLEIETMIKESNLNIPVIVDSTYFD